ncbi:sialidase family protein [Spirosoma pulveris]
MTHLLLILYLLFTGFVKPALITSTEIGKGIHPSVAMDQNSTAHIVYGQGEVLYYTTFRTGEQAGTTVKVDSLPGLHLGASRGPQIASTAQSVVITALDKAGNIWAYAQRRDTGKWQKRIRVNDVPDIAKEGFVAVTAGPNDTYNAAWLDLRDNKRNKLVGARSTDGGRTWSANTILYQSPDGTICECCQVSAVSQGKHVAFMFRNFVNGSRDMYLLQSTNGGQSFGKAEKLGEGTWTLNACPMDGGGLSIGPDGKISTVWRRADKLFTAQPGQPEVERATGKNPKIASTKKGDYIVFQQAGQLWAISPGQAQPVSLGPGAYAKLTRFANDRVLCLWEQEGTIRAAII